MNVRSLRKSVLYRYRYWLGYLVVIGFIIYFLGWQLGGLPGGLSQSEITTAARHTSLRDTAELPIYPLQSVLQWLSIQLFGVSQLSLRLPSVILALITAFLLYHLLRRWFGKTTALLSTALFVSADWFLFTARLGTGSIEFSLWLCLALLCFTKLLEHKSRWLVLLALSCVGLLFVPFGIYASITLLCGLFSSRVFRQRLQSNRRSIKAISIAVILLGVASAAAVSALNIEFLKNILGVQDLPTVREYFKNLLINSSAVMAVLPNANPSISPSGVFFVRFFELTFMLFGVIMFWRSRVNRLNLIVLILTLVLILASGLSSNSRGSSLILIPAVIYMTAGVRHLLHRWQRTFPQNPYARLAAFLPVTVLFITVVALHYSVYFLLWPSQTSTQTSFSQDFSLVQQELNRSTYKGAQCFVETTDTAVQTLLKASQTACQPVFPNQPISQTLPRVLILKPDTTLIDPSPENPPRGLVSNTTINNVRWLVVNNSPAS